MEANERNARLKQVRRAHVERCTAAVVVKPHHGHSRTLSGVSIGPGTRHDARQG